MIAHATSGPPAAPPSTPGAPAHPASAPVCLTDLGQRLVVERALDDAGVPLPLHARAAWARAFPEVPTMLVALGDAGGGWTAALGVRMSAARSLPGHQIWRVDEVGDWLSVDAATQLLRGIVAAARRRRRVLRIEVAVLARRPDARAALASVLAAAEFERVPSQRTYSHTLVLDLSDEATMLAALPRQTRRNVRAGERQPIAVRPIEDPGLADRMHALMRETLARTGAGYVAQNWAGVMQLSSELSSRSRLVGMFRTDSDGPDALLAFAWGIHHGDHVVYDAGASTRETDVRVAMAYPLIWDLITWAGRTGAAWFDFGGVTRPEPGAEDPLAGISDFKRNFSRTVEEVGEEWVLDVTPVRSAFARALGTSARALRSFARR